MVEYPNYKGLSSSAIGRRKERMELGIFEESAQKNLGECKRFGDKRIGSDSDNKSKGSRVEDKVRRMPEMVGSPSGLNF